MKQCTKCNEEKPKREYYFDTNKGRLRPRCKSCLSSYNKTRNNLYKRTKTSNEKAQRDNLTDRYIKVRLEKQGLPITTELIKLKRLQLLCKRLKN